MNPSQKNESMTFIWRVLAVHTIAYFVAGIFALLFMNYKEQFASAVMSLIMRPITSPWVAIGPALQLFRGALIAIVLLPFKETLLAKNGMLKLAGLILGLSYVSTIGPTFGSFEGYIYTTIPVQYHLLGIPETLVYVALFATSLSLWYSNPKKIWNILSIIIIALIVLMSFLGYLSSIGIISA